MPFAEGVPTVVVQLDKPRELAYTLGSMHRFRDEVAKRGDGPPDPIEKRLCELPIEVWACLDAEGRAALSVEQIEDMIHGRNLREVDQALRKLQAKSAPDLAPEEGADLAPDPTQAVPKLVTG